MGKRKINVIGLLVWMFLGTNLINAETIQEELLSTVCLHYKNRQDGSPGREILLTYNGSRDIRQAVLEVVTSEKTEKYSLKLVAVDPISVLLPPSVGVDEDATIRVNLRWKNDHVTKVITVPALRHWTVYIYPHSHVDIGYTNTQENVEVIHKRNLEQAIKLAEETADFPEGARFVWNPEVTWPIERYMNSATPDQQKRLLDAIRKGYIAVDAGYVSTNTSACSDEELFELFNYSKKLEKQTGQKVETMVQVDIPGVSWGIIPVATQLNIPYCLCLFNGFDRIGLSHEISFKPFWWVGPDGKSKVLFLQPGSYGPGAQIKGKHFWPLMAGQTDTTKLLQIVKTDNPRENFIDRYLAQKLPELEKADYYPYDIFPMTWCMADNTPVDADLPYAVKSWNEEFAFPKLIICSGTQMMKAFDEKYGDSLPVLSGDFTEYWTDGLGTSARHTGISRNVKEQLVQAETLWSMTRPAEKAPRANIEEIWRNIILSTEHTWAFMEPDKQPISNDILKVKHGYFEEAERGAKQLVEEALPAQAVQSNTVAVFNTHSWVRGGVVTLPASQSGNFQSVVEASTGKEVLSQRLSTGELTFMASNVPALGSKNYMLQPIKKGRKTTSFIKGNTLDNGLVKVTIDEYSGDIVSILCEGNEYVDQKAISAVNSYRYLKGGESSGKASRAVNNRISVKEDGPLLATLLVESDAEGCNSLVREVTVIAGEPHVELHNIVDKIAIKDKEGIHFGFAFDIPTPVVKVDVPWGIMELEKDQLPEANRNWIAFQRWLNISNNDKNVTWCSLDASVFESGDMTANILGGAFGSPKWIRKLTPSSTVYSWALNNHWHTNFALSQGGKIRYRYRVLPHRGKFDPVVSNQFGMEQIQPLVASFVEPDFELAADFKIKGDPAVVVSIVKTMNEGKSTLIRLRSVSLDDQIIALEWQQRKPRSLVMHETMDHSGQKEVKGNNLRIPAMSSVTIEVIW